MRILLFFLLLLAGGCQNLFRIASQVPSSQVISYSIEDRQFVILVVEANGVNEKTAKKMAMQKAGQVTLDNGYRYFTISSERTVEVAKTSESQSPQVPGNLYQELIVEKNFGRQNLEQEQSYSTDTYPAYRIEIECFMERPEGKKSYDAKKYASL